MYYKNKITFKTSVARIQSLIGWRLRRSFDDVISGFAISTRAPLALLNRRQTWNKLFVLLFFFDYFSIGFIVCPLIRQNGEATFQREELH